MNSIRTIHTAINFEIARQFEILSNNNGKVIRETRGVDSEGRTVPMREKDAEDTDYRFMIEPNLPILKIRKEWMEGAERELETQGIADFEWLRDRCGFDPRSAIHIAVRDGWDGVRDLHIIKWETGHDYNSVVESFNCGTNTFAKKHRSGHRALFPGGSAVRDVSEMGDPVMMIIMRRYPLAVVHRTFFYNKPAQQQHLFFVVVGICLWYFNCGSSVIHALASVIGAYLITSQLRGTDASIYAAHIFFLGYLLFGYWHHRCSARNLCRGERPPGELESDFH
ncbi:hypothetical protein CRE_02436 [Caenorhabditis remanei]|uniref:Aspartyl/Glutamyl-tRNA(Gln) amidotransferase subunit B/E catalytic domain-containing protein n=1 Tax=Caenorhabditis remanei TaxID=31234 RepID=E3MIR6_CAERE|nr:hypothetical protein CRE_02436 [Caenorhabditis remanei]